MLLSLDDYLDRAVNPMEWFTPFAEADEHMRDALLSPAAAIPTALQTTIVRARTASVLRLQQHLIFRVGKELGVLSAAVPQVVNVLQEIAPIVGDSVDGIIADALGTVAGVASESIGWVPIIGWCVKAAAAGAKLGFALEHAMNTPGTMVGPVLPAAHQYSTDTDVSITNMRLLPQAETRDWTTLFTPSMRGELHAQIRRNPGGNIVIAWGLKEGGKVPRIVIDDRPMLKPYTWHFSDNAGNAEGGGNPFTISGGLGAVPGTTQIIDVTQSAFLEPQNIHRGHETLGDPRCGSSRKTSDVHVGSWYPSTANGAWSLFGYCAKASASSYTIATQEVASAWQSAMDAIWEGIERLWRNESWEGGWGCGPWQNALQGLAAAHCVGMDDGLIGGFGAWMPPVSGDFTKKLTAADRNAWEKNNLYTRIVKPAMMDLREMQLALLRRTPMAAYLPAHGLGAMRDVSVKDEFEKARVRILAQPLRHRRLRRDDVVDGWYRDQIVARGIGSDRGDGGISESDYRPPRLSMPAGGGRGGALLIGGVLAGLAGVGLVIRARRRR